MQFWYDNVFPCIPTYIGEHKPVKQQQLAKWRNNIELQNIFIRLVDMALSRYDIENYPDTVSGRVLRMSLLFHGSVVFFKKWGDIYALPGTPYDMPNINGDYRYAWVYGRNGFNEPVTLFIPGGYNGAMFNEAGSFYREPDAVWVRENMEVFPFINHCMSYAERIADAYRVLDVNRHHMKTPYFIFTEDQSLPTVKKTMDMISDNVDTIVGTGVFDPNKVNLLNTGVGGDIFKGTTDLIEWYWNDFYKLCGLHANSNPDKKERLTTAEVTAGDEPTKQNQANLFDYLQEQLDFANECLGTDMKVKFLEKEGEDEIQQLDTNAGSVPLAASRNGYNAD